jgi:hypothetical protein
VIISTVSVTNNRECSALERGGGEVFIAYSKHLSALINICSALRLLLLLERETGTYYKKYKSYRILVF